MSDTPRTDAHSLDMETEDFDVELAKTYELAWQLERELNAAKAALSGRTVSCSQCNDAASKRCDWKQDEGGNWDTQCGQCMCFEYAPPNEQGYRFCHHCGATINFIKFDIDKEP